jgi:hypothetical protein
MLLCNISSNPEKKMIRTLSLVLSLVISGAAVAQTAAPQTGAQRGPISRVPTELQAQFRTDTATCRDEVKPRDLPRAERGKAMRACMEAKNPAYKVAFERSSQRREEMKQIRQDCRAKTDALRLTRDERSTSMQSCIVEKRPEMAKQFACQDQAKQKNLGPGAERREFMRSCRRS